MCIFCNFKNDNRGRIVFEDSLTIVIEQYNDNRNGEMLIVPKRHFADFFEITEEEWKSLYQCIFNARIIQDKVYGPDGYNLGININKCAGQDNEHVHFHLYPRYIGELYENKGVGYWINSVENVRK